MGTMRSVFVLSTEVVSAALDELETAMVREMSVAEGALVEDFVRGL